MGAVNEPDPPPAAFDRLIAFTLPDRDGRGRAVRLGPVLEEILAAHDYPPAIKYLLAEALVLTALMGGLLKSEGSQLTMQAQSQDAIVELLVCDFLDGALRGYVKHDAARIDELGVDPSLPTMFGKGALTLTFDFAQTGQRYQGVVPLEGHSLAAAVEHYFARSEQVPTLIRTAVQLDRQGAVGGGLLVQHFPRSEDGGERLHVRESGEDWQHIEAIAGSIQADELVDVTLALHDIVWRLFHEEREIRSQPTIELARGCRCSTEHFEQVLARFPKKDRRDMRDENGVILVDCAFCSRSFPIQD